MQGNLSEIERDRKFSFQPVETLADRIKHVRKLRRRTQEQFAEDLGVKRGAVGNWELGGKVSGSNLTKISDRYGVSLDWLQRGLGEQPITGFDETATEYAPPTQNARAAALFDLSQTVPLMGQGEAGPDGRFAFGEEIGRVPAPPRLAQIRDSYAVYVVGDSMEERYFHGEIVFVDPHRPYRRGHFVVAQIAGESGDPPSGYIKRFVSLDGRELKLEQLNPRKVLTFPRRKVVAVHRIIMGGEE